MAAASPAPRKRTPAKKAPAKRTAPAKKAAAGPAPAAAPEPPAPVSLNQWLHDLNTTALRVEAFDRWWELKQPTGGRAVTWDALIKSKGIRDALASMMLDETASPEVAVPRADGTVHILEALPGSAQADEFLRLANEWVPPGAAPEFWARLEVAIFGPGEPSAS